jgi:predicted esterase
VRGSTIQANMPLMRSPGRPLLCLLLPLLVLPVACDNEGVTPTRAIFDLSSAVSDLYALPYPNDLRLLDDGSIDLAGLTGDSLVGLYLQAVKDNKAGGFGTNSALYFRFSAAIADRCLPASPEATLLPGASISLVNIDKASLNVGQRVPLLLRFRPKTAGRDPSSFIADNHLTALPVPGFPLEPGTIYAAIITEALCDPTGDAVQSDPDFEAMLRRDPPTGALKQRAHTLHAPLRAYLDEHGITGVISAAVFTTGRPGQLAGRAREVIAALPAPAARELALNQMTSRYWEVQGVYDAPNFQAGTPPFSSPDDGGQIKIDAKGLPLVARTERVRFSLSVPRGAATPAKGWPVVLYHHGTGGSWRSFLGNGVASALAEVKDDEGTVISRMAVLGIDLNLHGARAPRGAVPELTFINVMNPSAGIDSIIQGGIDGFSTLRMVKQLEIRRLVWTDASGKQGVVRVEPPIRFDPERIYFMGHSQGGITGPVFLAHEPEIKGAVLSGAGGLAAFGMLQKTAPINMKQLFRVALKEDVDQFHPVINLIQQGLEPTDTNNYGAMLLRNRPKGVPPKHIFLSQGLVDNYTPNDAAEALAVAIGIPLAGEQLRAVPTLKLRDLLHTPLPLSGNLALGGESFTAALVQNEARIKTGDACGGGIGCPHDYDCVDKLCTRTCKTSADCADGDYCGDKGFCHDDGHFVLFHVPRGTRQYSRFLATMARDGVPTVVP